jgi:riboflavin synthase
MFTGIVLDLGRVATLQALGGDLRLRIDTALDASRMALGASVAVNGVCLTVAELAPQGFCADVSRETLQVTTLGTLYAGATVNIEPALRAGDALGGHIVSGHVDGVAEVLSRAADARSTRLVIAAPPALRRYIAAKGSVTLDGVSLTVNETDSASFGVNLIPHTLQVTTLGAVAAGTRLNLEVDALARYVERLLPGRMPA